MHAIGIDFGTTKTLVTRIDSGSLRPVPVRLGQGIDYVSTAIFIDEHGKMFFGNEAEDRIAEDEGLYLRGFKMHLGSMTPLHMYMSEDGDFVKLTAADLVREYLRYIRLRTQDKVFMGEPVTKAVITRPVSFTPALVHELKQAAFAAGFKEVELTTEPEAAGLAFCRLNAASAFKRSALVVDWGGGTLDFALVTRDNNGIRTHHKLTDGAEVGGETFDERIWFFTEKELRKQGFQNINPITAKEKIRRAKERLSSDTSASIRLSHTAGTCPPVELTRDFFNKLIGDDVNMAVQKVQQLILQIPEQDKPELLLLVGGSSHIPLIKEALEATCGLPARAWEHSREAVGLGAALLLDKNQPVIPVTPATPVQPQPVPAPAPVPAPVPAPEPQQPQSPEDLFALGQSYYLGQNGVEQSYEKAVGLLQQAAEMGHTDAQVFLGTSYLGGKGIEKNPSKGAIWLNKAAINGHKIAQWALGNCYGSGTGVPQSAAKAFFWYNSAAEQGYDKAQYELAECYRLGKGVAANPEQALSWYRKAAVQGHNDAINAVNAFASRPAPPPAPAPKPAPRQTHTAPQQQYAPPPPAYPQQQAYAPAQSWSLISAWKHCFLKNYLRADGRASRAELWYFNIFNMLVLFVIACMGGATNGSALSGLLAFLFIAYTAAIILPGLMLSIRRLHDINMSGWCLIACFIPLLNIVLAAALLLMPSGKPNSYGQGPAQPQG